MLVTELPTKKAKQLPNTHPKNALRSRTGCRGDRGLSATAPANQPLSRVRDSSQLPPNQQHIHLVEVKYCDDSRPRSQLEVSHHQHSVLRQHLRRAAANATLRTILLGVGGTIYRFFGASRKSWSRSSESHQACCETSCSFGSICLYITYIRSL